MHLFNIHWFATPENEWSNLFWRYLPRWLTIDDKNVLKGYYEGNSTLYTAQHLLGWFTPVLAWFLFIFVLLFVMLCINVILRKQWTENEKLTYPIIQLPIRMTTEAPSFFSNRLMWVGFATSGGITLINGLHAFYPVVPSLRISTDLGPFFTKKPLSMIGGITWLEPMTARPRKCM